jgi:hypothetical protein
MKKSDALVGRVNTFIILQNSIQNLEFGRDFSIYQCKNSEFVVLFLDPNYSTMVPSD